MKRITTKLFGVLLLMLMLLAACGGESPESSTNSNDTDENSTEANASDEKAKLRILWPGTSESEKRVATALEEQVKEKHSNIDIEFMFLNWGDIEQKMTVMVQSNDAPDLMLIQDITNPVAMDALEPLDSYLTDEINENQFLPATWEAMQGSDGTLYGIPGLAIVYSHIANTELFNEVGINIDELSSWEDVIEASHAIKNQTGKSGYSMANGGEGRFTFRDFMMVSISNGITPDQVEEEYKDQYIEVLELFNELSPDMPNSQITWEYPELFRAWEAGDVGMMHTGNYFTPNLIEHGLDGMDRTEPFAFPSGPSSDEPKMMVGTVGVSMLKGSEQKEASWKVIEELLSPEILSLWGGSINTSAGTYVDDAIVKEASKEVYPEVYEQHVQLNDRWTELADEYGMPMPTILGQPQMEKALQGSLTKMLKGDLTPEEAYEEISSDIMKIKENLE